MKIDAIVIILLIVLAVIFFMDKAKAAPAPPVIDYNPRPGGAPLVNVPLQPAAPITPSA